MKRKMRRFELAEEKGNRRKRAANQAEADAALAVALTDPMDSVGVVGQGFVGKAVARAFKGYTDVKAWDCRVEQAPEAVREVLGQQVIFICLPTPMAPHGGADVSQIDTLLCHLHINNLLRRKDRKERGDQTLVLMSTVPPGTCDRFTREFDLPGVVYSPAFMTARTNLVDFERPSRLLIGAPRRPSHGPEVLARLYARRFPDCPQFYMRAAEAEMVKYISNCFFAVKVGYFNEMHAIARRYSCRWDTVMEAVLADERIGRSHTLVPGPDGKPGFENSLLKDLAALMTSAHELCIDAHVLIGAWNRNAESRAPVLGPGIGSNF